MLREGVLDGLLNGAFERPTIVDGKRCINCADSTDPAEQVLTVGHARRILAALNRLDLVQATKMPSAVERRAHPGVDDALHQCVAEEIGRKAKHIRIVVRA